VYARTSTQKLWVATASGNTTVPIPAGQQYANRFLVEFHGVRAGQQAQAVDSVQCSAILFSEEEMAALVEQPTSFRGGYLVCHGVDSLTCRAVAYQATLRSLAVERKSISTPGASVARSRVGQRDAGPLLLAPCGPGPPSPFPFVPHRLPPPPGTALATTTTGFAFPIAISPHGTLLAPTSGQPLQPPPKRIVDAAFSKLLAVVQPGGTHPPGLRRALLAGSASDGLAAATSALVAVAPALCAWATGNAGLPQACDVQDVWDIALAPTSPDRDVRTAFRALGEVLSFRSAVHPAAGATAVAVMRPVSPAGKEIQRAVVIASPLDGHRATQNKALILLCTQGDWCLHFYDPLPAADVAYPIGTAEACHPLAAKSSLSLALALSLGTPPPAIEAVWPLDFCRNPAKLSDPWSVANVSDTASYAYFAASLADRSIAVMRVACNNRTHPGMPEGRVKRISGHDFPNPAWGGIEVLQLTN